MFDVTAAPRSAASSAANTSSISETLEDGKRASLDYQILRRTLMPDEIEADAPPSQPEAPSEPPAVSAQASDFQELAAQRELELNVTVNAEPQKTDPLVLDLAGNGFSTSGLNRSVRFDLDGDGKLDQISVPTGDDALLAYDRNGNGRIDDGSELFGDQNGAANGFAELRKYDDNGDGRIDSQDAIFERLSLLRFDAQGRQSSQSLSQAGVSAIDLQARDVKIALGAYDEIAQLGRFEFADGRSGQAADLLLAQR
ncbi:hypothetical protein [Pseudomonas sp. EA_35y_Pfl2_R5]|uniref:hypothetical protein n=1 Tax=Pseudomonas sp. EA_35y_Pfl2_R5 TaxID=3088690 RepID=UPI0030D96492